MLITAYSRLALCSIEITRPMICNLGPGTLSHALNARIMPPRKSFPGIEVM